MKHVTFTLTAAAAALLVAGSAQAQVIVTTGGGYVKMVEALAAQYEKDTGAKVEKAFGGNIGQMLAQVESGSPVTVVISDATSLRKFTKALNPEAGARLGDTPLILAWRKGLELKSPADLKTDAVKRVAMPDPKAAGFVNLLAARQGKAKLGGFVAVKEGYEPIRMTAQPVKGEAGEAADVKAFLAWLASPKADAVLEKFGVSR